MNNGINYVDAFFKNHNNLSGGLGSGFGLMGDPQAYARQAQRYGLLSDQQGALYSQFFHAATESERAEYASRIVDAQRLSISRLRPGTTDNDLNPLYSESFDKIMAALQLPEVETPLASDPCEADAIKEVAGWFGQDPREMAKELKR